ncbi:hypothetical protein [Epibacterium ulvae]|nr:hypothetical protein [Epibacterium ulvae]
MKYVLFTAAGVLLLGPLVAWTYVVALGCAYKINVTGCGPEFSDYLDSEFLTLAALPWLLGLLCLLFATQMGKKGGKLSQDFDEKN